MVHFAMCIFYNKKDLGTQNKKPWLLIPNPGLFPALHNSVLYRGAAVGLFFQGSCIEL